MKKFAFFTGLAATIALTATTAEAKRRVMPWMCLERCHENITNDLIQLHRIKDILSAVSFEAYDLDFGSVLKNNGFTPVFDEIRGMGLEGIAMITTANMDKVRDLWKNTTYFIDQAAVEIMRKGYDGYNIDFEPSSGPTPTAEDAKLFAKFVDDFAKRLHSLGRGFKLSVDVATWSPLLDYDLLAATEVDTIMTMDTYCGNDDLFLTRVDNAVEKIGLEKLGIGLEIVNPNTGKPFTKEQMQLRFDKIKAVNDKEIDIWECPIPELWLPFLEDFVNY